MFLKFGFVSHDDARLKISTNPLIASLLQLWSGLVWNFTCASQRNFANVKAHGRLEILHSNVLMDDALEIICPRHQTRSDDNGTQSGNIIILDLKSYWLDIFAQHACAHTFATQYLVISKCNLVPQSLKLECSWTLQTNLSQWWFWLMERDGLDFFALCVFLSKILCRFMWTQRNQRNTTPLKPVRKARYIAKCYRCLKDIWRKKTFEF